MVAVARRHRERSLVAAPAGIARWNNPQSRSGRRSRRGAVVLSPSRPIAASPLERIGHIEYVGYARLLTAETSLIVGAQQPTLDAEMLIDHHHAAERYRAVITRDLIGVRHEVLDDVYVGTD